jgi:hypothetical protein
VREGRLIRQLTDYLLTPAPRADLSNELLDQDTSDAFCDCAVAYALSLEMSS